MATFPLWLLVAATLGWCGVALRVSFLLARCCAQVSPTKAGKLKLVVITPFLLLPFVLLSSLLPWANARVALNFTYCWVTPCKLLLLACANFLLDCPSWAMSRFSHFLLAMLLPVRIKGPVKTGAVVCLPHGSLQSLLFDLCALICFLSSYDSTAPPVSHAVHCLVLYLVLDLPHRIASMALLLLYGMETLPAFHKPWLATSLTDFWGKRWDLTANALLRHTVYNPIINILTRGNAAPEPLPLFERLVGVNITFAVSGLIHELLYFTVTQAAVPTWEVTAFFIVHGVATSAEITMRRAYPKHSIVKLPRPLKVGLTMCFIYTTAAWLFFPQLVRADIFRKSTQEYRAIKEIMGMKELFFNTLITAGSHL